MRITKWRSRLFEMMSVRKLFGLNYSYSRNPNCLLWKKLLRPCPTTPGTASWPFTSPRAASTPHSTSPLCSPDPREAPDRTMMDTVTARSRLSDAQLVFSKLSETPLIERFQDLPDHVNSFALTILVVHSLFCNFSAGKAGLRGEQGHPGEAGKASANQPQKSPSKISGKPGATGISLLAVHDIPGGCIQCPPGVRSFIIWHQVPIPSNFSHPDPQMSSLYHENWSGSG